MRAPTVLALPLPAQGHVNPMMTFSQKLIENGCKVIFVNTDFNHRRVVSSMVEQQDSCSPDEEESLLKLVSIPDGLGPDDDRNDLAKLYDVFPKTMPEALEKLIEDIHVKDEKRINFIVADLCMAWALDVGSKLGIKELCWVLHQQLLSPCCTASLFNINHQKENSDFSNLHLTQWWLCNTTHELEPETFLFLPKIIPIGPLLKSNDNDHNKSAATKSMGQFWKEDQSCMSWLDEQADGSVLYVAFGNITLFDQNQFNELALGLDLTNRPFLWVIREDNKMAYPHEFQGHKGKIVNWAPQQKVLSHPAIACFVTHCGWNSTTEGLSNGVPFLCWPYFGDQLYNKAHIVMS
ncbi:hypothetical protein ACSQ67_026354 [Phaseolus vulgaris]